jgi:hypothetical protein
VPCHDKRNTIDWLEPFALGSTGERPFMVRYLAMSGLQLSRCAEWESMTQTVTLPLRL